ncbi:Iron-sulfur cluster carrier protein [Sulfidibacter corallicola]|uniref:Iron-sulfur cluster carrier protein n=1 Tax=Sulfidibacter corallicola TaxID=2818388 RepID=A0A8A4TE59_SULCO|nr:P-loop NTPase [Sulfidibacter corallicola]QTD47522.1 P-loop NTPase [Sulfidibacter corallicola]
MVERQVDTQPKSQQPNRGGKARRVIAVHSAKGGVGKSTLCVNLAVTLARRGLRVGLLDADLHGPSATIMLGNAEWPDPGPDENTILPLRAHGIQFLSMGNLVTGKTPVIWRGAMVHQMLSQFYRNVIWDDLDYLFLDMPPGTGDALLTTAQVEPPTGVLVVTTPQELSLVDTLRGMRAFRDMNVPILGFVENMSYLICGSCSHRDDLFGEGSTEALAEELDYPLLGSVPIEPEICASSDRGTPFVIGHPDSESSAVLGRIAERLIELVDERAADSALSLEWREMDWLERSPEPPEDAPKSELPLQLMWQVSNDELGLMWSDGERRIIGVRNLRLACPCARCVDEVTGKKLLDPLTVPDDITLTKVEVVGRYGIAPHFSDGHHTGIFTFPYLREI